MAAPQVKIEDSISRIQPGEERSKSVEPSSEVAGGVYHGRALSRIATDRRSVAQEFDADEAGDWRRNDDKKQEFRGRTLLWSVPTLLGSMPASLTLLHAG